MSVSSLMPIFIVASAIIGGLVAWVVGRHIPYGIALGMLIGFSPLLLLGILIGLVRLWRPDRPRCLCGHRDYVYVTTIKPDEEAPSTWTYHYRCVRCERNFLESPNAFDMIREDGVRGPYMTHSGWGRWRPASG